jgi:hypothetical protein
VPEARLRGSNWGCKAWKWCNFGGEVWELWRRRPGAAESSGCCAKLGDSSEFFDEVNSCIVPGLLPGLEFTGQLPAPCPLKT